MSVKDIEKYNKELYKFLENKIKEKQIKKIELCEKIGIVSSTLSEQLNRLKNGDTITTSTLFKIMLALDINPLELWKEKKENKNSKMYKNIKKIMKEKKITVKEISEKLDIQEQIINKILEKLKNGESVLTETIFELAGVLEIEPTELLK